MRCDLNDNSELHPEEKEPERGWPGHSSGNRTVTGNGDGSKLNGHMSSVSSRIILYAGICEETVYCVFLSARQVVHRRRNASLAT